MEAKLKIKTSPFMLFPANLQAALRKLNRDLSSKITSRSGYFLLRAKQTPEFHLFFPEPPTLAHEEFSATLTKLGTGIATLDVTHGTSRPVFYLHPWPVPEVLVVGEGFKLSLDSPLRSLNHYLETIQTSLAYVSSSFMRFRVEGT